MKQTKYWIAAGLLLCGVSVSSLLAAGEPNTNERKEASKTKERKIRELMQLSGAGKIGKQAADALLDSFKNSPGMSNEFLDRFRKEIDPSDLVDMIVPIYGKYLAENDIDALIEFYKSPVGRKLTSVQPQIMRESVAAGQKWGQQLATKIVAEMRKQNQAKGEHE